ncbi:hypothetical protein BRC62_05575 [Halobacteriales archaeon QH_10_67_13]|nr:MAG: hypothetical protein BRC62_05575 [Halobacteriales archaeon QH_10_67_13]
MASSASPKSSRVNAPGVSSSASHRRFFLLGREAPVVAPVEFGRQRLDFWSGHLQFVGERREGDDERSDDSDEYPRSEPDWSGDDGENSPDAGAE